MVRSLYFSNSSNQLRQTLENEISDQLSEACAKFYSLSEHLAVNEVTVLCKGRDIQAVYS